MLPTAPLADSPDNWHSSRFSWQVPSDLHDSGSRDLTMDLNMGAAMVPVVRIGGLYRGSDGRHMTDAMQSRCIGYDKI